MQPAMNISLVLLAEALSPGSTRQNNVLIILSMTCTYVRSAVMEPSNWCNEAESGRHAVKISLFLMAEALSPGSTRQKSVPIVLFMTCTDHTRMIS